MSKPTEPGRRFSIFALVLSLVIVLTALLGCTPQAEYVQAEADTYTILEPYARYGVDQKPGVDAETRQLLRNKLISWKRRIELAGGKL